jgi:hypothetical protein
MTISMHGSHRKHRSPVAVTTVACAAIGADRTENTAFQPVHWRMLGMCCLATGVVYRVITYERVCMLQYCNRFDQRVARQQLCKQSNTHAVNNTVEMFSM